MDVKIVQLRRNGLREDEDLRKNPETKWFPYHNSRTSTLMSLIRKGLIEKEENYILTSAGEKVCELLDMALGEYKPRGIKVTIQDAPDEVKKALKGLEQPCQ